MNKYLLTSIIQKIITYFWAGCSPQFFFDVLIEERNVGIRIMGPMLEVIYIKPRIN
jgi:hypothetical protein